MAFGQSAAGGTLGTNKISLAFGGSVTAGEWIAVGVSCNLDSNNVTDSLGTDYKKIEAIDDSGTTGEHVECFIGRAIASGANTVSVNTSGNPTDGGMAIATFTNRTKYYACGLKHSQNTQAAGSFTTSPDQVTGTAITAHAGDDVGMFIFDTGALRTNNYSAGTGFTEKSEGGNVGANILDVMIEVKENVSSGSITPKATAANNDRTLTIVFAFTAFNSKSSYLTTFSGSNENPMDEVANASPANTPVWIQGARDGGDWGDTKILSNKCVGTLATTFHDNTSVLAGDWPGNQWFRFIVYKGPVDETNAPEVEGGLRRVCEKNLLRGYEVGFSLKPGVDAYLIIVRWNGPVADFHYMFNQTGSQYELHNGDVVEGTIIDDVITVKVNGNVWATVNINDVVTQNGGAKYLDGAPGLGTNADTGVTDVDTYGFSKFEAGVPPLPFANNRHFAPQQRIA